MKHRALTLTVVMLIALPLAKTHAAQQTAPSSPSSDAATFEAVSIKRANPDGIRGFSVRSGGRVDQQGQTMVGLIKMAYGVRELIGGPEWVRQDLYTVQTTANGAPDAAQLAAMLRHMLADRFKLVAHIERRDLPVYALTVARTDGRLGPNLVPHTPPCEPPASVPVSALPPAVARSVPAGATSVPCGSALRIGGGDMTGVALNLPRIAQIIEQFWLNAPVRDQTGLSGRFDVTVENMINQWGNRAPTVDGAPSDAASLPAALREQLGLRIEQGREASDVVVVDHLERPTEN